MDGLYYGDSFLDDKRRSQELLNGKIINGWVGIAIKYALILKTKEKLTMDLLKSIFYFVLAGLFEIGGGYLIWLWLRDGKNIWYGLIGAIVLIIYGAIPTHCNHRVPILDEYMQHMVEYLLFFQLYGDGK